MKRVFRFGRRATTLLAAAGMLVAAQASAEDADYRTQRAQMVETIAAYMRLSSVLTGKVALDQRVAEAIARVPRHAFVPKELAPFAYLDRPLPVGHGQKVSQPYMVALMTDLVAPKPGERALVVGIGGGYHAAILQALGAAVSSVEMDPQVAKAARERLQKNGTTAVDIAVGDPYFGWPRPDRTFDAIVVRLAMDYLPTALVRQLAPGGRMIIPLGRSDIHQDLTLVTKTSGGEVTQRRIMPVRFTRLPGGPRI